MANEQNLRPCEYKLSQEEQKRGGIKSGETRRRKRTMRETAEQMMNYKAPEKLLAQMRAQGIPETDDQYVHAVVFAQVARALKGDSKAAGVIMELMGEKVEKVELTRVDEQSVKEMEKYFAEQDASL